MALVGPQGVGSICLSWPEVRLIRGPHEVRSSDDVLLFYGPGMAQEARRFSIESDGGGVGATDSGGEEKGKAHCSGCRTGKSGLWRCSPPAW